MGKNEQAPKWTKNMREYVINRLAMWKPYKEVWVIVTSPDFEKDTGLEALDPRVHNYDLFRMRCKRIPKHEVATAHEEWQREVGAIRWGDEKDRIQGLSDLIDKVTQIVDKEAYDKDTTGTMAALVGQLRQLFEQVRKEISAEADRAALSASGARILLANPKNVEISMEYVEELLLVYRQEIGGLHNMDLKALNTTELKLLRDACQEVVEQRINEINETEYEEIKGNDDKTQTDSK